MWAINYRSALIDRQKFTKAEHFSGEIVGASREGMRNRYAFNGGC